MMGKAKAQERLLKNLGDVFAQVQREYHLPAGTKKPVKLCFVARLPKWQACCRSNLSKDGSSSWLQKLLRIDERVRLRDNLCRLGVGVAIIGLVTVFLGVDTFYDP